MLELKTVAKAVGSETHLSDLSLRLENGTLNVLLGPTLSGKTSLMRIMAGLDRPTSGEVWFNDRNVTGVAVQKRNVAMVYQQFINYPALSVYENIASPLRIARTDPKVIDREVRKAAELLKLSRYLDRQPLNLSGGQQQRTAIARAIVKNAELVLLDEPLANLDYKLREELRTELPKIFAESGSIFVYATTEPSEALLLGGNTATLCQGRVTQFGPTVEVFRNPVDLITAQTFSDPPMNVIEVHKSGSKFHREGTADIPVPEAYRSIADRDYTVGFRPHHLSLKKVDETSVVIRAKVKVTEITGSESYVHLDYAGVNWVMLTDGIHDFDAGETIEVFLDARHILVFDAEGQGIATDGTRLAA